MTDTSHITQPGIKKTAMIFLIMKKEKCTYGEAETILAKVIKKMHTEEISKPFNL